MILPCSKERTRNHGSAMTTRPSLRPGPHGSYLHALRMARIERACRYDLPLGHENEETATCLASGNVVTARDRKLSPVKLAEVVTGNTRHLTPLDGYAGLRIAIPSIFMAELDAHG